MMEDYALQHLFKMERLSQIVQQQKVQMDVLQDRNGAMLILIKGEIQDGDFVNLY